MKKSLVLVALMATATLFMSSCEQEPVQVQSPKVPAPQEMAFTTVVRVPLSEGRPGSGESEILNLSQLRTENVEILAPAFREIWKEVSAGKYDTYPIEDEFPEGITSKTFLSHVSEGMEKHGTSLSEASMTGCLEVEFAGTARKGSSKMEAKWVRFVWLDTSNALPDRNICQVRAEDLKGYTVHTASGPKPFLNYLNERNYDGYPINVGTDKGMARMRSLDEALEVEVLTAQGELGDLNYMKAN